MDYPIDPKKGLRIDDERAWVPRKFAGFARRPRQNANFMSLSFKLFLNSSANEAASTGNAVNHTFSTRS